MLEQMDLEQMDTVAPDTVVSNAMTSNTMTSDTMASDTVTSGAMGPLVDGPLRDWRPPDGPQLDGPPADGGTIVATLSCPQPNTTLCTVTGQVNLVTAPLLADTLTEAVHDARPHLVVDLSAVALLDSAGLEALAETLDRFEIHGHLAVVVNPRSETVTASTRSEITGLHGFLDMHRDLSGALRACAHASISTAGRHRAKAAE